MSETKRGYEVGRGDGGALTDCTASNVRPSFGWLVRHA
jgi:hypothetical protein